MLWSTRRVNSYVYFWNLRHRNIWCFLGVCCVETPEWFFLFWTRRWLMAMGSKLYIALPSLIWRWWNRPAVIGTSWDGEKMEGTVMECHNIPTGAGFMLINEIMGPWAFDWLLCYLWVLWSHKSPDRNLDMFGCHYINLYRHYKNSTHSFHIFHVGIWSLSLNQICVAMTGGRALGVADDCQLRSGQSAGGDGVSGLLPLRGMKSRKKQATSKPFQRKKSCEHGDFMHHWGYFRMRVYQTSFRL